MKTKHTLSFLARIRLFLLCSNILSWSGAILSRQTRRLDSKYRCIAPNDKSYNDKQL